MAYTSTDKETLIKTISTGEHTEIHITSVFDSKDIFKAMDIRTWYNTSKDPEMKPTIKGVRIKSEDLADVIDILIQNAGSDVQADLLSKGYDIEF